MCWVFNPVHVKRNPAVSQHDTNSLSDVAANLLDDAEQSLVSERFLPAAKIAEICENFGYQFRERIYTPTITH